MANAFRSEWHYSGLVVRVEEPDIFFTRIVDSGIEGYPQSLRAMGGHVAEVLGAHPEYYWLMDLGEKPVSISADVRRESGNFPSLPFRAYVAFGGSPTMRAMIRMVMRGTKMLGRPGAETIYIVKEEAEARAWIETDRETRKKKGI